MSSSAEVRRVVSADALLGILADHQHLLVLGCVAGLGRPAEPADVQEAAGHAGVSRDQTAKSLRVLASAGVVRETGGLLRADPETFARVRDRLLERDPVRKALREHPDMKGFVRDGVIDRMPDAPATRHRFATFVAACLPSTGRITEAELNAYLRHICSEPVELRRLLVDERLWSRDPAGRHYWPTVRPRRQQ
jgi:hypothetical protein